MEACYSELILAGILAFFHNIVRSGKFLCFQTFEFFSFQNFFTEAVLFFQIKAQNEAILRPVQKHIT